LFALNVEIDFGSVVHPHDFERLVEDKHSDGGIIEGIFDQ
jgi:hypothetical protein